jgi:hypothetical protein
MGGIGAFAGGLSLGLRNGASLVNQYEDANAQSKMNEQRDMQIQRQKNQDDIDKAIREASSVAARQAKADGMDDDEVPLHAMQAGVAKATELDRWDAAANIKAASDTYRAGLSKKYFDLGDRTQNIDLYGRALTALTGTPTRLKQSPDGGLIYEAEGVGSQTISAKDAPGFLSRVRSPDTWRALITKNAEDERNHQQAIELKRLEQTGQLANTELSGQNQLAVKRYEVENAPPIQVDDEKTLVDRRGEVLRPAGGGKDPTESYNEKDKPYQEAIWKRALADFGKPVGGVDDLGNPVRGDPDGVAARVASNASAILKGSSSKKGEYGLNESDAYAVAADVERGAAVIKPAVFQDEKGQYWDIPMAVYPDGKREPVRLGGGVKRNATARVEQKKQNDREINRTPAPKQAPLPNKTLDRGLGRLSVEGKIQR